MYFENLGVLQLKQTVKQLKGVCRTVQATQRLLKTSLYKDPEKLNLDTTETRVFKGTKTQNIFSLKSCPKHCTDLGNVKDLQKKRRQLNLMIFNMQLLFQRSIAPW